MWLIFSPASHAFWGPKNTTAIKLLAERTNRQEEPGYPDNGFKPSHLTLEIIGFCWNASMQWENSLTICIKHKKEIITKYRVKDHQTTNHSISTSHGNTGQPPSGQNRCPAGRLPPPPFPFSTNIAFLYSSGSYFLSLFRFGASLILGKLWESDLPTSGFWWFVSVLGILEDWVKEMLWGC